MRSRTSGMWWGTALEAPDPGALAFQVGDLDDAVAEAVALGASLAPVQPQDNVRVLFDPAGHPLCLCRDDG